MKKLTDLRVCDTIYVTYDGNYANTGFKKTVVKEVIRDKGVTSDFTIKFDEVSWTFGFTELMLVDKSDFSYGKCRVLTCKESLKSLYKECCEFIDELTKSANEMGDLLNGV